jgi:type IV pilus assembly protein PilM
MSSLGIYFGPKMINLVESRARKIVNNAQILQPAIFAPELEEKVPVDLKASGITALFKDEFKKYNIAAKDATLCLSGRDLIVRTFEMPMMPREELQSAINFEVKRYIPFKVEDLVSNSQIFYDRANHTNLVLFIGIKKETLDKYVSILEQLNISIRAIEYSVFSTLRCLQLAGINYKKDVTAFLLVDLEEQDEVNFTILDKGFPLFSRDITLENPAEEFESPEATKIEDLLNKLKTEIRVSLDYFHRKFPNKRTNKIFLLANQSILAVLESIIKDMGISVQYIDLAKKATKTAVYSLSFIKSYSASLSKIIKTPIKIDLLAAKEKPRVAKEKISTGLGLAALLKSLTFDPKMVILGLLICLSTYGYGAYRINPVQKDIDRIISMRPNAASMSPGMAYEQLTEKESEYQAKLVSLETLIKKQFYLTPLLNIIPRAMPEGIWLSSLDFNKQNSRIELTVIGFAYLDDPDKEIKAVNQFVSNLKQNANFSKNFQEINITSINRASLGEITGANFYVSCKTNN